ncbi:MAG: hypothetical protein HC794_10705, partial [Nitrospiraceae bacterium]|nr:hypothetical protein [Nitrospiraceae bacterium]
MEISKHTVTLGFRYGFQAEAAPPPPPPPPPPADPVKPKQFIIFFGFDRCDITAEADRVLTDAANTAKAAARPRSRSSVTRTPPALRPTTKDCRNAVLARQIQYGRQGNPRRGDLD